MKTFKNVKVGVLEVVPDKFVEQYEKRPDLYTPVTDKTKSKKSTNDKKDE